MSEITALVERLQPRIGMRTAPIRVPVELGTLQRFARYTGESDPAYLSEVPGGPIAPPTFVSWFLKGIIPDQLLVCDLPLRTTLHTDDVVELGEPIRPGDVITVVGTVTEIFERRGRAGDMLFQSGEITLTNQDGAFVGSVRVVTVHY
jgi:hypothetical protein